MYKRQQYGEPNDPRNAGIAAMLGTYRSFANPYGQGAPGGTDMSGYQQQIADLQAQIAAQGQGQPAGTAPTNAGAGGGGYSGGYGGGYSA